MDGVMSSASVRWRDGGVWSGWGEFIGHDFLIFCFIKANHLEMSAYLCACKLDQKRYLRTLYNTAGASM